MYGSDRVLLNTLTGLKDNASFWPVVILEQEGPLRRHLLDIGIECHVAPVGKVARGMLKWSAPWHLAHALRCSMASIDKVVHRRRVRFVYSNTLAVLGGAFWSRSKSVRHLWHVHEIVAKPRWARRLFPWLVKLGATDVVCNSSQTRDWLTSVEPALAKRLFLVSNGIAAPTAPAPFERETTRASLQVGPEDVLITLVGRLNHMKGQALLLETIALLRSQGRLGTGRVALVGDAVPGQEHFKQELEALVDRLQLKDRVRFVPFVQDIYPIWRASDIAVVPSTQPESFGMVAIEAMACGLPVVAAAHGGALDIIIDGQTGLLFKPCDVSELAKSLAAMLENPQLREQLGQAGKSRQAQEFQLGKQIAYVREVIDANP